MIRGVENVNLPDPKTEDPTGTAAGAVGEPKPVDKDEQIRAVVKKHLLALAAEDPEVRQALAQMQGPPPVPQVLQELRQKAEIRGDSAVAFEDLRPDALSQSGLTRFKRLKGLG